MKRFILQIPLLLASLVLILVAGCQTSSNDQDSKIQHTVKEMVEKASDQADLISIDDLASLIERGKDVNVIDIRTQSEFDAGHIFKAKWIPRGRMEFASAGDELPPRDELIVVYCKEQGRASFCAVRLEELGYTEVKYLEGGFEVWCQDGHSIYNLHGELVVKEFGKKEQ